MSTPTIASPVAAAIAARKEAGSGALIGYLPVGFPDLDTSVDAAVALLENGVDISYKDKDHETHEEVVTSLIEGGGEGKHLDRRGAQQSSNIAHKNFGHKLLVSQGVYLTNRYCH